MSDKHAQDCVDYIYESEFEDFVDWVRGDGNNVLSEESAVELMAYHSGHAEDAKVTDKLVAAYKEAAKFHIYASAWLARKH
jgi:hypothetical protein